MVLNREDAESPSKIQATSFDPFRDVIRTEPAPDLPSLIEDMIPYMEHRISTPATTTRLSFDHQISLLSNPNFEDKYEDVVITTEEATNQMETMLPAAAAAVTHEKTIEITTEKMMNDSSISYDEDAIFSFDSMLDLLFSGTTLPPKLNTSKTSDITENGHDLSTTENIVPSTKDTFEASEEKIYFDSEKLVSLIKNNSSLAATLTDNGQTISSMISESITLSSTSLNFSASEEEKGDKEIKPLIGGLLKLAGCNIYGRMYRVGRIIVELSTPCLECRCTDVGVQCKQLKC